MLFAVVWGREVLEQGDTVSGYGIDHLGPRGRNFFTDCGKHIEFSATVEATSLNMFKARMDGFLIGKGIKGYGDQAGKWS